jgi:small subunit ribosomal protein S25e
MDNEDTADSSSKKKKWSKGKVKDKSNNAVVLDKPIL